VAVVVILLMVFGGGFQPAEVPAWSEPTEEPMEEPAEEPTEAPMEEPAEEEVEEPAEELAPEVELLSISAPCENNELEEIEALDPMTVRFTLCRPDPAFLAKAAHTSFAIQPREWIEETGGTGELLERPIGTGRYRVEEWDRGDRIVFGRFEEYWGEPAVTQQVIIRWEADPEGRLIMLQAGDADFVPYLPDSFHDTVRGSSDLQFLTAPGPNTLYLGMTDTFAPWDDVRIRWAIAMGIDRAPIVNGYYPPGAQVPTHFTPCSIPNGCLGTEWYPFDPDYGRELLAEAGYPEGFPTTLYYRDVYRSYLPDPGGVALEIQAQLRDHLDVDVDIVVMESGEFIELSTSGSLDGLYLLGWGANYMHVTDFVDFHFSRSNLQFGDPHPDIYQVLEEAATIPDEGRAALLYEEANNAIRDLVPMVPIAHGAARTGAARAEVAGAHVAVFGSPAVWKMDPDGRGVLNYLLAYEPHSLYCIDETDRGALSACQMVTEGLYQYNEYGDLQPRLATSCEAEENAAVWICSLRSDVRFHDGSALDANDVVRSWDAGVNAASPYHTGNWGSFEYPAYLFGGLMNSE
jgi:ABC-type transport system substrate-binding protein